jgi:hypothetical protein
LKYILVIAYYLANPGGETDIVIKTGPKIYDSITECQFDQEFYISQANNRHFFDAKCLGVQ